MVRFDEDFLKRMEIKYVVNISSGADEKVGAELARLAADDCYITNTLKKACPVKGEVIHNGRKH